VDGCIHCGDLFVAGEIEGEVLGGSAFGAGGFAEGDVADVEGAFDALVAFEQVLDGEDNNARGWSEWGVG
jgi:hypothetical protein